MNQKYMPEKSSVHLTALEAQMIITSAPAVPPVFLRAPRFRTLFLQTARISRRFPHSRYYISLFSVVPSSLHLPFVDSDALFTILQDGDCDLFP